MRTISLFLGLMLFDKGFCEIYNILYKRDERGKKMADFYIRNLDPGIASKLSKQAKERGMSRNKFISGILTNYALAIEVKEIDDKYRELCKIVIDSLEGNAQLLNEVLTELKEKKID